MTNVTTDPKKSTLQNAEKKNVHQEPSLKGTFVSVMLLGGFLVLSWLSVFCLFISRN